MGKYSQWQRQFLHMLYFEIWLKVLCIMLCILTIWQTTVCWGHDSWTAALQDVASICGATPCDERHRSRRLFHTWRDNGMLLCWWCVAWKTCHPALFCSIFASMSIFRCSSLRNNSTDLDHFLLFILILFSDFTYIFFVLGRALKYCNECSCMSICTLSIRSYTTYPPLTILTVIFGINITE